MIGVTFHDDSRLSKKDKMICDLIKCAGEVVVKQGNTYRTIEQFQPHVTLDVFRGKLYINGD